MNTYKLVRISLFGAILCTVQVSLSFIGNVELVSPLLLVLTLSFDREALYGSVVFVFLQGIIWGFGLWWLSYLYVWPALYFFVQYLKRFNKNNDFVFWSVMLGFYGLFFGALFAIVYIPISFNYAVVYWINGLFFDIVHGISNALLGLLVCKPLFNMFEKIKTEQNIH